MASEPPTPSTFTNLLSIVHNIAFSPAKRAPGLAFRTCSCRSSRPLEGARLQNDLTTHLNRLDIPICGLAGAWRWEAGEHHSEHHTVYLSGSQSQWGHGCGVGIFVQATARLAGKGRPFAMGPVRGRRQNLPLLWHIPPRVCCVTL